MGLPELEFIELYNNSSYNINLSEWILQVNDRYVTLPDSVIEAKGFLCLVSSNHMDTWNKSIPTAFVKSMPALLNSGFKMIIFNNESNVIDAFHYQTALIPGEGFKKDGGWSTERIDPDNKSGCTDNFHWSMNLNGGTPGRVNSVNTDNPDMTAPVVTSLKLKNNKRLLIDFSETMDFSIASIATTPELRIKHQSYDTIFLNQLQSDFEIELDTNAVYELKSINMNDMAGNKLLLDSPIVFGVPDSLMQGDLLINEVLFNPFPNGSDFVELYNISDKLINLVDLYFAKVQDGQLEKLYQVSQEVHLLLPHSYVAITTDKENILQNYTCPQPDAIIETSSLPSYPDAEGHVAIANKKGIVLDEFTYHQNMHFDLLKDNDGVSLERLSHKLATQDKDNWRSAASTAGFATPGYINSQQLQTSAESNRLVSIQPEVFTPDNDGIDDRMNIQINSDATNTMVTIRIYDSNGKEVRYLINNQSLAQSSTFAWDGLSDNGAKLKPGIYLIFVQCVYSSGKVHEEKMPCVIGVSGN
ncbi:MAG: lamin tail domain-containing protein, partial [Bacteroidales bacterium]|nr:lamin tail domain-containing protein [Bacteroidales bacterium]